MNAAIRAVVRTGLYHGLEVFGIMRGYQGMYEDDIMKMESRSVANIIQRGGTILKTARSKEFFEYEAAKKPMPIFRKEELTGWSLLVATEVSAAPRNSAMSSRSPVWDYRARLIKTWLVRM